MMIGALHYLFPDESPQAQELSVDSVQGGFQEVSLSRVLRVEQIQQPKNKFLQMKKDRRCYEIHFERSQLLGLSTWSMYFLTSEGVKSGDSKHRRKNS